MNVAEAHVDQRLQLLADVGNVSEHGQRVFDGEVEDVGDRVAVELDRQRLLIVTAAVTNFAGDINIGHEVHLDTALAVSLAGLAAAAGDVEGKPPRLVAALAGLGEHREEIADGGEDARVSRRVRARGAANGRLVDSDGLVDLLEALDLVVFAGLFAGAVELFGERAIEDVVYQ